MCGGVCLRTDGTASFSPHCRPQRRSTGNLDSKATGAGRLWCPVALLPASSPEKCIVLLEDILRNAKASGSKPGTGSGLRTSHRVPLAKPKHQLYTAAARSQLSLSECLGAKKPEGHLPHRGPPAQDELHKRQKYYPAASRMTSQGLATSPEPQAEAQLLCCLATQPFRVLSASLPSIKHLLNNP